jgi:hypothetical protein
MKALKLILNLTLYCLIISCTTLAPTPNNKIAPLAPADASAPAPQIKPALAAPASTSESSVFSRKQYIENRGAGGVVNKITVDQSGTVPNYVIYPNNQPYDTNNNPDPIATPRWEFKW